MKAKIRDAEGQGVAKDANNFSRSIFAAFRVFRGHIPFVASARYRRRAGRQAQRKRRSFTWLACDVDRSRVMLSDTENHRQTETGALLAFCGEKGLKTTPTHFLRHAYASVADFEQYSFALRASSQCQGAALRHRIHRVENQIDYCIAQSRGVSRDGGDILKINFHADLASRGERLGIPFRLGE